MSTANSLLLRTVEGLLLELQHDPRDYMQRYTARLCLRPSASYRRVGLTTGHEVARTWANEPPHLLDESDSDPSATDRALFLGTTMFNVPLADAARFEAWLAEQQLEAAA